MISWGVLKRLERMSYFKKAAKNLAYAKLALMGPSGSGKTMSSLLIAKGFGGRTGVIDTENNSSCLYSDRFEDWEYFVLPINPPYTPEKYIKAIDLAIAEGIEVLIIDSLSHVWAAEGGLLSQKEALDSRAKTNKFTNWASITKSYEILKAKLLHSKINLICTMRSKQAYVISTDDQGKQKPERLGMAPIMRDGMEYEFTTVFDLNIDHEFIAAKDRTGLFDGVSGIITEDVGKQIRAWLNEPPTPPSPDKIPSTPSQDKADTPADQSTDQIKQVILPPAAPVIEPPVVIHKPQMAEPKDYVVNAPEAYVEPLSEINGKPLRDCDRAHLDDIRFFLATETKKEPAVKGMLTLLEIKRNIEKYLGVPKSIEI